MCIFKTNTICSVTTSGIIHCKKKTDNVLARNSVHFQFNHKFSFNHKTVVGAVVA